VFRVSLKFSVPLSKIAAAVAEDVERAARAIAFETFQRIVYRTPVDTGRARGGWQIALDSVPGALPDDYTDKSGGETVANAAAATAGFGAGMNIRIVNNVVYILPLEFGHSQQAPSGMARVTLRELPDITRDVAAAVRASPKRI